jgi:hypothetical protein
VPSDLVIIEATCKDSAGGLSPSKCETKKQNSSFESEEIRMISRRRRKEIKIVEQKKNILTKK